MNTRIPWSAAEQAHLESLAGDQPWPVLRQSYNRWAALNGYPARTDMALIQRCERLGLSRVAISSYLSAGTIRRELGLGWNTVDRWLQSGHLAFTKSGRKRYIHRPDLQAFARQNPAPFAGHPRQVLLALLDDIELADQLSKMPRQWRPGLRRRVRCVETRRVYSSVGEAAAANHLDSSTVSLAVRGKRATAGGHHWEYLEAA